MKKTTYDRFIVHTQGKMEEGIIYSPGAWRCGDIQYGVSFSDADRKGSYVVSLPDLWAVVIRTTLTIPLSIPNRIKHWVEEAISG